jgi:hypothetical protein
MTNTTRLHTLPNARLAILASLAIFLAMIGAGRTSLLAETRPW